MNTSSIAQRVASGKTLPTNAELFCKPTEDGEAMRAAKRQKALARETDSKLDKSTAYGNHLWRIMLDSGERIEVRANTRSEAIAKFKRSASMAIAASSASMLEFSPRKRHDGNQVTTRILSGINFPP